LFQKTDNSKNVLVLLATVTLRMIMFLNRCPCCSWFWF